MSDHFYHWFALTLLFAVSFGAVVARALDGAPDIFNIAAYGGLAALASAGAIRKYRQKGARANG